MRVIPKFILGFVALLLFAGTASAAIGQEIQITNATNTQKYAYIYENRLVWMDDRTTYDYFDIRVYDLGPDGIFNTSDDWERVAAGTGLDEYYPDIYGDLVPYAVGSGAYSDPNRGSADENITLFNLATNVTSNISTAPKYQCCPQVYNITVAWHDKRRDGINYDIYTYDLGPDGTYGGGDDGGEFQVTNATISQEGPQIWGRNLVWRDRRYDGGDIFLYDAGPDGRFNTSDDRGEFRVTTDPDIQSAKDVRDRWIVWRDHRNWTSPSSEIYGYDMGPDGLFNTGDDKGEFQITNIDSPKASPRTYGRIITWLDKRDGDQDVYIYDLGSDKEFNTSDDGGEIILFNDSFYQNRTSIYGGRIVYDSDKGGVNERDIYMFDLVPHITIDSPQNTTYTQTQIDANVTLNIDGSWCGYSLNGADNVTMSNDSATHFYASVSALEGQNNITFSCNGTVGFMNINSTYFTIPNLPPYVADYNYTKNMLQHQNQVINVTWADAASNVSTSWLYRNDTDTNYTANSTNGDTFGWVFNESIIGTVNVTVYANDSNGNMNTSFSLIYNVVNRTVITLESPKQGKYYNSPNISINGTTTLPANVTYSLNGGPRILIVNNTKSFSAWNASTIEGQNNLTVYAVNAEDASDSTSQSVSFYVDVTFPDITYNSDTTSDGTYPQNWVFVNVSINEANLDTVTLAVTGGLSPGNYTITNSSGSDHRINQTLDDGTYSIVVYATDLAGNVNGTAPRTITLDTTGPLINITSPLEGETYSSDTITLNYTTDEPVDWSAVSFDSGTNQTGGNQTFTEVINGVHTITVYVNDSLGNMGFGSVTFTMSNDNVGRYNNNSVALPANQQVTVTTIGSSSSIGDIGVALDIAVLTDVTGSLNFTEYSGSPTVPLNSSFLTGGNVALDTFVRVNESADIRGNLSWAVIKVYYNTSDLDRNNDSTLGTGDINKDTLKLYWYDNTNSVWRPLTTGVNYTEYGGPYVNDADVETVSESGYLGYVWANVTSLSYYGVGGSLISAPVVSRGGGGGSAPQKTLTYAILTTSEDWRYAMMAAGFAAANNYILITTPTNSIDLTTRNKIKWFDQLWILGNNLVISGRLEDEFKELRKSMEPGFAKLDIDRIGGVDYFDTALQLAKLWKDPKGIIVVRGDIFPDTLVAGQLSAVTDSPILFTMPGEIWASELELIKRMKLPVTIIGGEKAVSKGVEGAIKATGVKVKRIGGKDRYETAALVGAEYIRVAKREGKDVDAITFLSGETGDWASTLGFRAYVYDSIILYTKDAEGPAAVPTPTKNFVAGHPYISSASIVIKDGARPTGYDAVDAYIEDMQFKVDPSVWKFWMDIDTSKKDYALDTDPVSLSTTVSQKVIHILHKLGVLYRPSGGIGGGGTSGGTSGGGGGGGGGDGC